LPSTIAFAIASRSETSIRLGSWQASERRDGHGSG
jgi:hypothetical protein